jgi:TolB protein
LGPVARALGGTLSALWLCACATGPATSDGQGGTLSAASGAQGLTKITSDSTGEFWPTPSPDGRTVLYVVTSGQEESAIWSVDPDRPDARQARPLPGSWSGFPAWLPDGSGFVFVGNARGTFAVLKKTGSSPDVALVSSGEEAPHPRRPTVSPDGLRVCFAAELKDVPTLVIAGRGGTALEVLGDGDQPAWSADGSRIVFARSVGGRQQVFSMEPRAGATPSQLTWGDFNSSQPAWSPDGQHIVFASDRHMAYGSYGQPNQQMGRMGMGRRGGGGNRQQQVTRRRSSLFVMRADGSAVLPLTEGTADTGTPAWSKDGWVYFTSNQAGSYDLWRIRPALDSGVPLAPPSQSPSL